MPKIHIANFLKPTIVAGENNQLGLRSARIEVHEKSADIEDHKESDDIEDLLESAGFDDLRESVNNKESAGHKESGSNEESWGFVDLTDFTLKNAILINQRKLKNNHERLLVENINKIENEAEIFKHILDNSPQSPILHLVLDASLYSPQNIKFSLEGLREFKRGGGKIIITLLRFRFGVMEHNDIIKHSLFNYLEIVDKIVFASQEDRTLAIRMADNHFRTVPCYLNLKRSLPGDVPSNGSLVPKTSNLASIFRNKSRNGSVSVLKLPDPNAKYLSSKFSDSVAIEISVRIGVKEEDILEEYNMKQIEFYTNFIKSLQEPAEKRINPRDLPLLRDSHYIELLEEYEKTVAVDNTVPFESTRNNTVAIESKRTNEELALNQAEKLAFKAKAFKAWRNMPLTQKQACKNETRAFAQMQKLQGIYIPNRAESNFKNLVKRLRKLEGPYSTEMRTLIESQRKNGFLLPEEKLFVKRLLASDWKLKHVTPSAYYESIHSSADQLQSVFERSQSLSSNKYSHTPTMEGNADNVFFTFGPGDTPTVRFLDKYDTTIFEVDYKRMMEDVSDTLPETQLLLQGLWSSDHFYAYGREQEGEPISIYGTKYYVNYRKISHDSGCTRWVKHYHFIHADGNHYTQTLEKGDEIFTHPRLDLALLLMVVEKIRFLGTKAWKEVMAESNLKTLQTLVHTLYHPGVFEVHKPRQFILDHPYVTKTHRAAKTTVSSVGVPKTSNKLPADQEIDILRAAFTGDIDTVIKAIEQGFNIDTLINVGDRSRSLERAAALNDYFNDFDAGKPASSKEFSIETAVHVSTLNLLAAAIYAGQTKLLEMLLERGADINVMHELLIYKSNNERTNPQLFPMDLMLTNVFVSNPEVYREVLNTFIKIGFMPRKAIQEIQEISESARASLKILTEKGSVNKNNRNIRTLVHLNTSGAPENEKQAFFIFAHMHPDITEYLLKTSCSKTSIVCLLPAIIRNQPAFLREMLRREIDDIDQPLSLVQCNGLNATFKALGKTLVLKPGYTPVLAAIEHQNLEMLTMLLEAGADVNKPFYAQYSEKYPNLRRIHEHSGFTPLKFAQRYGEKGGEYWRHLYKEENTELRLNAENKHRSEIIQFLLDNKASLEPSNLLATTMVNPMAHLNKTVAKYNLKYDPDPIYGNYGLIEEQGYKIIDHQVYILITMTDKAGQRYFVLNNLKKTNNSLHLCLEGISLDFFYPNKWLAQVKRRTSTPCNLKDVRLVDYGQVSFGVQSASTYYCARFLLCDLGVQPEYCTIPWQERECYIAISEVMVRKLYKDGVKNINYFNANFSDIEAELMCSYKNPNMDKITKAYESLIRSKHTLIALAQNGDIVAMHEILKTGFPLQFTLPFYSPLDKNFESGIDHPIMISMFSRAMVSEEYDVASYLLEMGYQVTAEDEIDNSFIHRLIQSGAARLYKQLYDLRLTVLLENMQEHLDAALEWADKPEDYVMASVIHKCKAREDRRSQNADQREDPMPVTPLFVNLKNAKGSKVLNIYESKKKDSICSKCVIL